VKSEGFTTIVDRTNGGVLGFAESEGGMRGHESETTIVKISDSEGFVRVKFQIVKVS